MTLPGVDDSEKRRTHQRGHKEAPTSAAYLTAWTRADPDLAQGTRAPYQEHIRRYLFTARGAGVGRSRSGVNRAASMCGLR